MRARTVSLGLLVLSACQLGAEEQFIGTARLDECDSAVPVCSSTAGCRLSEGDNYVLVRVPGYRSFVVNTEGEADVYLHFYWKKQIHPGSDVEFTIYEPGCGEPHRQDATGEDMFRQIGQDHTWQVMQTVYQAGDHLVELRMDAQGEFLLKAEVVTPIERDQPRQDNAAWEPGLPTFP
ncbi:MAG: hypothetical protein HY904_25650 [Deltaproteobacteria bacterium]|nr:hypothetical protein [Deltaproteobacteria bacterium]